MESTYLEKQTQLILTEPTQFSNKCGTKLHPSDQQQHATLTTDIKM